jgi:hypothetical protein
MCILNKGDMVSTLYLVETGDAKPISDPVDAGAKNRAPRKFPPTSVENFISKNICGKPERKGSGLQTGG